MDRVSDYYKTCQNQATLLQSTEHARKKVLSPELKYFKTFAKSWEGTSNFKCLYVSYWQTIQSPFTIVLIFSTKETYVQLEANVWKEISQV